MLRVPRSLLIGAALLAVPAVAFAQGGRLTATASATATLGQTVTVHLSGEGANNPTYENTNAYGVLLPPGNACPPDADSARGYYPAQDRKVFIDKQLPAHPAFELDGVSEALDKYTGAWAVCAYLWTGSMGSPPDATSFGTLAVTGGGSPPPPPPPPAALAVSLSAGHQTKAKVRAGGFTFSLATNHPGALSARVYVKSGSTKIACGGRISASYAAAGVFKRASAKPSKTSSCARVLRKRTASATIVVTWTFTDTAGASKSGSPQFKVTRS